MEKWADLSQWQGLYNMAGLKKAGYTGVILRASHGHTQDPYYAANLLRGRAAGLRIGHYHYYESGQGEAAFFISVVKPRFRPGDAYPVMDYETPPLASVSAVEFTNQVKAIFGGAGFYSSLAYIAAAHLPPAMGTCWLWVAAWGATPPPVPLPWRHYALWQKADHTGAVNLDLDIGDMTGALSRAQPPKVYYLDVVKGGRVLTRVRYGGGRVAAFLRTSATKFLHDGATLVRAPK